MPSFLCKKALLQFGGFGERLLADDLFLGPSRHGNGAVKKSTHASTAPVAKSSKFRRHFRRIRMKKIMGEFR